MPPWEASVRGSEDEELLIIIRALCKHVIEPDLIRVSDVSSQPPSPLAAGAAAV
jgi:hypothetical protein